MNNYRSGRRETQADFQAADYIAPGLSTIRRPGALTFDYLTAFSLGPVDIGDASLGAIDRPWRVRMDGNDVFIAKANDSVTEWEPEILLFTVIGDPIVEVDLAFDQNGRVLICAERHTGVDGAPEIWLYWYNPTLADFEFASFGPGWSPRALLDNPIDPTTADILVFAFREGSGLIYLQQRDLYAIEYTTPVPTWEGRFLEEVLYVKWNRLVCVYSTRGMDETYTIDRLESTLFPTLQPSDQGLEARIQIVDSYFRQIVIDYEDAEPEAITTGVALFSGLFVEPLIIHSQYPEDAINASVALISGALIQPLIIHSQYREDAIQPTVDINSGSLVVAVITHQQYREDAINHSVDITGGSLV